MSPSPVKMTSGSDLLTQCLEFSQALEQKGRAFHLKVTVGNFSFTLDSRETTPKEKEIEPISDKKKSKEKRKLSEEESSFS